MSATRFCMADKEELIRAMSPDFLTKFAEYPFTKKENLEIFRSTFHPDVLQALDVLKDYGCERFLNTTERNVVIELPGKPDPTGKAARIKNVRVDIPDGCIVPEKDNFRKEDQALDIDSPYLPKLRAFIKQWLGLRAQELAMAFIASEVIEYVNTPGQFKFVFPKLVNVLDSRYKSVILKSRAGSKPPRGITPERVAKLHYAGQFMADALARDALAYVVESNPISIITNSTMDEHIMDLQLKSWGFRESIPHMEEV